MLDQPPKVFISYSYDSSAHQEWVLKLWKRLRENGVDAKFDKRGFRVGRPSAMDMNEAFGWADRVLCICTDKYVERVDRGKGGAGYEGFLINAELVKDSAIDKFIPIVRNVMAVKKTPTCLDGRIRIDLSDGDQYEEEFERLLRDLHEAHEIPPLGPNPFISSEVASSPPPAVSVFVEADDDRHLKQLIKADDEIGLDDFVGGIARDLRSRLSLEQFPDFKQPISAQQVENRLQEYAALSDRLAFLAASGCRWAQKPLRIWKDSIEIIAQLPPEPDAWYQESAVSRCLRLFPAMMTFYAAGIGAIIGDKHDTLHFLFHEPRISFEDSVQGPAVALTPWEIIARHKKHYIGGGGTYLTWKAPLSRLLQAKLEPAILPLLNHPQAYSGVFDKFEYLLGLSCLQQIQEGIEGRDSSDAYVGRFATRDEWLVVPKKLETELEKAKDDWPPLKSGLIRGPYLWCKASMAAFRREAELFRNSQRHRLNRPKQYPV